MPAPQAVLRITSEGRVRVSEIREYLVAIEDAYNGIYVFENLMEGFRHHELFFFCGVRRYVAPRMRGQRGRCTKPPPMPHNSHQKIWLRGSPGMP